MTNKDKLEKLKKLADAMYYAAQHLTTDASSLYKAMDEYHQFIVNEYHKEEPVSEDTKESVLYNDMKPWEVPEYIIEAINKKRVCPTLKREALHKFKNEFNTLKQTLHFLYNLDTSVNYRLALHWASWGAQNLQGCFGISEEEKAKMDTEEPVSEDNTLRKASEEYLKVLSETPYNNTPITNAQTIVRELISFLDNPSKYNPNHIEETVSEDLEQAIDTYLATYFGGEKEKQDWPFLKKMAIHFANWQKEQLMANAVDGDITFDYYGDGDKTYGCIAHDSFCLEDFGLKDRDKVKVIVIKEE